MVKRTFIVHYEQWLEQDADAPGWSEHKEITVRLTSDALTGGWLQQFGDHPVDYLVLTVIALHARPLTDDDIDLLLPLVTAQDKGRLFAYLTDLGLADMLGMNRRTIIASTERLGNNGHLIARKLDKNIQLRFKGRFNGDTVYILSGNVAIRKELHDREKDRVQKMHTVNDDRVHLMSPSEQGMHTNLNTLVVVDAVDLEHIFDFRDEAVFGHFAAKKGNPYKPTGNDRKALKRLREAGYSLQQITTAIDEAFDRGDNPTTFAYCARIVEDYRPALPALPAAPATPALLPASPALPADLPEEIKALANTIAPHLPERDIPNLGHRLKTLADSCAEAASQHGATGEEWLRDALQRSTGKDDPLAYAAAVLRAWAEHGPAADLRPTRDGYHPPRRASTAAPANPAGANGNSDDSDPYRVIDPPLLPMPEK